MTCCPQCIRNLFSRQNAKVPLSPQKKGNDTQLNQTAFKNQTIIQSNHSKSPQKNSLKYICRNDSSEQFQNPMYYTNQLPHKLPIRYLQTIDEEPKLKHKKNNEKKEQIISQQQNKQNGQIGSTLVLAKNNIKPQTKLNTIKEQVQFINPLRNYKTTKQTNPTKKQEIQLKVNLINNQKINFNFQKNKTVNDLKKYITRKYQTNYLYQQIVIIYQKNILKSNSILQDILMKKKISITIKFAQIYEIQELISDKNGIDQISTEQGVARASCGHFFGRGHMNQFINYQVNTLKNNQICCPHLINGTQCQGKFDMLFCRFVAGFTNEEANILGEQLNQNWIKKYAIECPRCTIPTSKRGLQTKRLICSVCCYGPFCTDCRELCNGEGNAPCTSVLCEYLRTNVVNAPWTRVFMMYKYPNVEDRFPVKVPNVRLCPQPNCRQLVYNIDQCKHTNCSCIKNGGYSFCYVCLSLAPETGDIWKCGKGGFEYCGFVAPNQVYKAV